MAYVLGYLYADGSLEDATYLRGKYIRVTSVERHIIEKIRRWLNSEHTIVLQESVWPNGRQRYMLRIGSHKMYATLVDLGLYPNKSLTMRFPTVPRYCLPYFIRGYLDGDGCVYLYTPKGKNGKKIVKKLSVIFTSGSEVFLKELNSILRNYTDIKQERVYKGHRSFQLRYGTFDSIQLFKFLYHNTKNRDLYFKRKFAVFTRYFRMRPTKIDKTIKRILDHS